MSGGVGYTSSKRSFTDKIPKPHIEWAFWFWSAVATGGIILMLKGI